MKLVAKLSLILVTLFFVTSIVYAQNRPDEGTVGLSASIQSSQTNLQLPIWLSENTSIAPIFGLNHQDDSFTSFNVGIAPRFYQNSGGDFASYIGARGLLQHTSPEVGDGTTDLLLGATGGGEYFLDEHFSMGVEGQLNLFLNDNGNNSLSTGAAIIGAYYF
jgi:hypothetical protein